jgi:hypothetical protein
MKITLFLSHCCALNNEQWLFRVFYLFTRWDWLRSSTRLRFYHLTCLRFNAEMFLFVIFSTFSFVFVQLFFIYRSSFRSLRNHYLTLFFSLTITMRWSWNDRRREKNCWRKRHRLSCVVLRARLWIEKEWEVAKILKAKIKFRTKKRKFDVVFKRFEVRFIRFNVYDLFYQFFSKRNNFVFIENDERRFWLWKSRTFELIWRRRRDWRSELTRNERREFRRRRSFELTEHSRRNDLKDRVLELIEKLRRNRREDKKMNRDESVRRRWKKKWKRKKI